MDYDTVQIVEDIQNDLKIGMHNNEAIKLVEKYREKTLKAYRQQCEAESDRIIKRNKFILRCLIIGPLMLILMIICNYFDNEYANRLFFGFCWAWTTIDLMARC